MSEEENSFHLDIIVKHFWQLDKLAHDLRLYSMKMFQVGVEIAKLFPLINYFTLTREYDETRNDLFEGVQNQWNNLLRETVNKLHDTKSFFAQHSIEPISCLNRVLVSVGMLPTPLPHRVYEIIPLFEKLIYEIERGSKLFASMSSSKEKWSTIGIHLKIANQHFNDKNSM